MVAAGVYMLVRVAFLMQASPQALLVIAWIGTITAVMAGLIATQQNDIKRILAYSTALAARLNDHGRRPRFRRDGDVPPLHPRLLQGAALPRRRLDHRHAAPRAEHLEDGRALRKMRITFLTFLIGTLALIGFPFTSGFFSKDAILAVAHAKSAPLFCIALFTAFLTAFYMLRLVLVVFFGKSRSEHAAHGNESPLGDDWAAARARHSGPDRRLRILRAKLPARPARG
jgi:NADH-quinone oxidoreductase subunit L